MRELLLLTERSHSLKLRSQNSSARSQFTVYYSFLSASPENNSAVVKKTKNQNKYKMDASSIKISVLSKLHHASKKICIQYV